MRATLPALIIALSLAASAASAQDMANMKGMSWAAAKTGQGTGVIKAIDAKAGKLTLQHGPIPAIGWPAMTMAFKANPPALLNGLKVGQKIGFDVKAIGMDAEVTAIRKP
jgi:Cu(I)/Ag(I) efflux system protein CusF